MEPIKVIPLAETYTAVWGKQGENNAVQLSFDLTGWENVWPDGNAAVAFRRADGKEYAHEFVRAGNTLLIPVKAYDNAISGSCAVVISWIDNGSEARTVVINGRVNESIVSLDETPTPPELGVIEQVNAAAAEAYKSQQAALVSEENAANSEENAATSEENAATSETNAKAYADAARANAQAAAAANSGANAAQTATETAATNAANSETNAQTYATNAANSETNAQTYATNAKASAENAAASKDAANTSAQNAANSAAAAAESENNAAQHAQDAQEALENMEERYYVPSVTDAGDLSFTPTSDEMPAVPTVNIRGPQGEQGIQGVQGIQGIQGIQGPVGPVGAGADWNAKEGETGHVLNRTHYVDEEIVENLPETTLTAETFMGGEGWYLASPFAVSLVEGKEYTVMWNGTEYKCTAQAVDLDGVFILLGNVGKMMETGDTGEPFVLGEAPAELHEHGIYGIVLVFAGETTATVAVSFSETVYHKLDYRLMGTKYAQPEWGVESGVYIYPEMTLTADDNGNLYIATAPAGEIAVGDVLTVNYDGADYECTVFDAEPMIGQAGLGLIWGRIGEIGIEGGNADAPFIIMFIPSGEEGVYGAVMDMNGAASVTLSIKNSGTTMHKIPEEYLDVKKTHWVQDEEIVYIPDTEMASVSSTNWYSTTAPIMRPKDGDQCIVTLNGVEYKTTARTIVGNSVYNMIIGDIGAYTHTNEIPRTTDPFRIALYTKPSPVDDNGTMAYFSCETTEKFDTLTLSVKTPAGMVQTLDRKFLPDNIPPTIVFTSENYTNNIEGLDQVEDPTYTQNLPIDLLNEAIRTGQLAGARLNTVNANGNLLILYASQVNPAWQTSNNKINDMYIYFHEKDSTGAIIRTHAVNMSYGGKVRSVTITEAT